MNAVQAVLKGMFENAKVYLIAFGICAVMAVGTGIGYRAAHAKTVTLQAALSVSQANEAALRAQIDANTAAAKVAAKQRALVLAQAKERNAQLQNALAASVAWADQSVPGAVADSLRGASAASATGSATRRVLPRTHHSKRTEGRAD